MWYAYYFACCSFPVTALPTTALPANALLATAIVKYLSPDSAQMRHSPLTIVDAGRCLALMVCGSSCASGTSSGHDSWNLHRKCPRSVQYQMFLSMAKIMLMLPSIDQSKESFTQQVHDAVDTFCTQYAEQADYVLTSKSSGERRQVSACLHMIHAIAYIAVQFILLY